MKAKFRAWDKKEKRFIQFVSLNEDGSVSFLNSEALWQFDKKKRLIIQFFTGLKDNTRTEEFPKGKEIYDGDIVSHAKETNLTNKCTMIGCDVVLWDRAKAKFKLGEKDTWGMIYKEYKIIGNIHENKNLLES